MAYALFQTPNRLVTAVFVVDEGPNGTVVLVRCGTADGDRDDAGVAIPSSPPRPKGPRYIFARRSAEKTATRLQLDGARLLSIDTSQMPRGPLVFALEPFIKQLEHIREDVVRLDPETARDWGWRRADADPPGALA